MDRRGLLARAAVGAVAFSGPWWRLPVARAAPQEAPLKELARLLRGPVVGRASSAYNAARVLHNQRFDNVRPLAIASPLGTDDVLKAIGWARKHGIRLVARSGGHSYCGFSTVQNGLVLDFGRMKGIIVQGAPTITSGPGAPLGDVYARLASKSLVVPAGSCKTVGVSGLALGGGHGFYSRKYGLTCDNVTELEIVTADGKRRVCNARQNADLFWACRGGGGGNFGVVTRWTFRASPVGPIATFRIAWPWSQMQPALQAWQSFAPHAPDELFSVFRVAAVGPGGSPGVTASGQYLGTQPALASLIQPLASVGTPTTVSTKARTYMEAVDYWGGGDFQETFAAKSDYARTPLSPAAIGVIGSALEARGTSVPGSGVLILDSYGGAINRVPRAATAFAHRDALFSFQYLAIWGSPAQTQQNLAWLRDFHKAMRPYVTGEAYVNYCDEDLANAPAAYYGSNLKRLRAVKKKYDPTGFFRYAQSVR
jgi:FAD/FMN-containing dehydrogenase